MEICHSIVKVCKYNCTCHDRVKRVQCAYENNRLLLCGTVARREGEKLDMKINVEKEEGI